MRVCPHFVSLALCLARLAAAEEQPAPAAQPASGSLAFDGEVKLGAGLDDAGHPVPDEAGSPRLRLGFSLTWSLRLEWGPPRGDRSSTAPQALELTRDERTLLDLLNAERKSAELPPLKADPVLMQVGRDHSAHMARLDQIGHELEGRSFSKRLSEGGYIAEAAGENVAEGAPTPAEAVAGWMTSPGHRGNILNEKYTHTGVGLATSDSGRRYYTQVFARPFPADAPRPAVPDAGTPRARPPEPRTPPPQ
jgi:hypothetical protein